MPPSSQPVFDIIVLGGGSAGCVLAARLSEDSGSRVLLVEAGPDLREGSVPKQIASPYPGRAYFNKDWTWPGLQAAMGADPSNSGGPTVRPYEQGRMIGGSSAINGMGANRGAPADFEEWVEKGADGWGWSDVLPYFRKLERDLDYGNDGRLHNDDGPLPIQRQKRATQAGFVRRVEAAMVARGFSSREDQNGDWQDGVYPAATNFDEQGRRASVGLAYLTETVRLRPNLQIWTEAVVDRVLFEGKRAVGARLRRGGEIVEVYAGLVIVSAGALHSPALLQRSGIGPGALLQRLGITPVAVRPGVGRNLQEHPSIGMSAVMAPQDRIAEEDRYHLQALLRWSSGLEGTPQGDMHIALNARSGWHAVAARIGTLFCWVNKSYSHGFVELASPDAGVEPIVDFRLLSDRRDLLRLAESFRLSAAVLLDMQARGEVGEVFPTTYSAEVKKWLKPTKSNGLLMSMVGPMMDLLAPVRRRVVATAVKGVAPLEMLLRDEAVLHAHLLKHVGGVWHACGTCRLGAEDDAGAVCDPIGRVIGVDGLMVCDGSVMPSVPCANLNVPIMMIAEKTADAIKSTRR
jgi:5-(hydroxymethyl)furfural/furfural oxidase